MAETMSAVFAFEAKCKVFEYKNEMFKIVNF